MISIATATFVTYGICFVLLSLGMLAAYRLFKLLEKRYPSYYRSIGSPRVISNYLFPTFEAYLQRLKGATFCYALAFKGIPKQFPDDVGLRRLAQFVRYIFLTTTVLFAALAVLIYFYYRSGQ